MVTLVEAPRGLDMPVGSVALVDADDIRLGLGGRRRLRRPVLPARRVRRRGGGLDRAAGRARPATSAARRPSSSRSRHRRRSRRAVALGTAVVAVEPRARWELLYKLVNHAFEHHGDRGDPLYDSGTDLFGLAQSIADRTHGMISIEDDQSHVLAYSASNDEADELRRLTILGRAGPPEHLEWIGQWGIFDALRASGDVVRVAERPELGLRPRLAVGIHLPRQMPRRPPGFAGTIWLQQGSAPLADDVEEVLRGGAVLAARIMSRLAAAPSTHTVLVQDLLGLDGRVRRRRRDRPRAWQSPPTAGRRWSASRGEDAAVPANVIALSASAFRADAQVASTGERVYVLLPKIGATSSLTSWVRGMVAALRRELGLTLRAVIAAPLAGLAGAAAARAEVDRVFDSAERHPGAIGQVTSLDEAHTTVLLDEIVAHVAGQPRLVDPRVRELREQDPMLADTLAAYLDGFGDIAAVAQRLHVHPNTVRYRVRRIEKLLSTSLDDPDDRLVLALGLRATEP